MSILGLLTTDKRRSIGCAHSNTLPDGRVLITGGSDNIGYLANTYIGTISGDTISRAVTSGLPMSVSYHIAIALLDGRVLLAGGVSVGAPIDTILVTNNFVKLLHWAIKW